MVFNFEKGFKVVVGSDTVKVLKLTQNDGEFKILVEYTVYPGTTLQEKMEMGADHIKETIFKEFLEMYIEGNLNHFDIIKYRADYYSVPDDLLYNIWCYASGHNDEALESNKYGIMSIEESDDFI